MKYEVTISVTYEITAESTHEAERRAYGLLADGYGIANLNAVAKPLYRIDWNGDDAQLYDGIEISGVREFDDDGGIEPYIERDNANPDFYSVYLRLRDGGCCCVGDFGRVVDAISYANVIHNKHGWPIYDYTGAQV